MCVSCNAARRCAAVQMTPIQSDEVIAIVLFPAASYQVILRCARTSHHRQTARPIRKCRALALSTQAYSLFTPCHVPTFPVCCNVAITLCSHLVPATSFHVCSDVAITICSHLVTFPPFPSVPMWPSHSVHTPRHVPTFPVCSNVAITLCDTSSLPHLFTSAAM